jgi:predicted RNase H-like HicB family nuclease
MPNRWKEPMAQPPEDRVESITRPYVAYPALLATEGQDTLISFPDCPGCQAVAGRHEEVLETAREALTGWLQVGLEDGGVPPHPSAIIQESATGQVLMVPVSEDLAQVLEDRWNR